MQCPFCGAEINQELPFCTSCGKQWAEGKMQSEEVPIEQDSKSSEEKVPERKLESSQPSHEVAQSGVAQSEALQSIEPQSEPVQPKQGRLEEPQPELAEGKENGKGSVAPPSKQNTMGRMFSIPVIVLCIILFWPLGIGLLIARIVKQKKMKQGTNGEMETGPRKKKGIAKKVGIVCAVIFVLLLVLICALPTGTTTSETAPQQETGDDIGSGAEEEEKEQPEEENTTEVDSKNAADKSEAATQSGTKKEPDSTSSASDYSIQLNFPPLSNQYTFAQRNNVALQNFPELSQVISWYADMEAQLSDTDNFYNVQQEKELFSDTVRYKITSEYTGVYYIGNLKDNRPDGIGYIIELQSDDLFVYLNSVYLGNFVDGYYNGYGLLYKCPDGNEIYEYKYYRNYPDDETFYNGEYREWLNHVCYEGYFSDGVRSGQGNTYAIEPVTQYDAYYFSFGEIPEDLIEFQIFETVGTYDDGKLSGTVTVYGVDGYVEYRGNMENGEKSGQGVEYYSETTQVKYEGSFKNDLYDGQGTMYDQNGKVIYSGAWKDGDYA